MNRRHLLAACGTAVTGLLAGCGGGGDGDSATPTATGTAEATATQTAEPTATATPEATATQTPEPTATPTNFDGPTHSLGESFTVGTGRNAIGYRIIDFYRADRVGSDANYAVAKGTYLIIILEISNPTNEPKSFPQNRFHVANQQQLLYINDDATEKIADDSRIDVKPIGTATVLSGKSKTGAVLFDVSPDRSYYLRIRPPGDAAETHYVPVGPMSEVTQLQSSGFQ